MKICFLFLGWIFLFNTSGFDQVRTELKPKAAFSAEKIQVGAAVRLTLSLQYPSKIQILFPDTNAVFGSFELRKREFYPTKTIGEISKDCVVYELATFNLDSIQTIQLPIIEFSGSDSTRWNSNVDSVFVSQVFYGKIPDKPVFQTELSPVTVAHRINYPYILIGLSLVLLLIFVVNFFFDRPIQKFIYLFIEQRRHSAYLRTFDRFKSQLEADLNIENMEGILNVWKKYIQRVDGNPYTSLTSMEIFKILPDLDLKDVLQEVDRWIYGGVEMKDFRYNIDYVKQISLQLYQKKRDLIRDGKFE